jgi:hypothetical protein
LLYPFIDVVDPLMKPFPKAPPVEKQIKYIPEFAFNHVQKHIRFRFAGVQSRQNGVGNPFSYFHFFNTAEVVQGRQFKLEKLQDGFNVFVLVARHGAPHLGSRRAKFLENGPVGQRKSGIGYSKVKIDYLRRSTTQFVITTPVLCQGFGLYQENKKNAGKPLPQFNTLFG